MGRAGRCCGKGEGKPLRVFSLSHTGNSLRPLVVPVDFGARLEAEGPGFSRTSGVGQRRRVVSPLAAELSCEAVQKHLHCVHACVYGLVINLHLVTGNWVPRAWMVELSGVSGWGAAVWGGWEIPAGSALPEHHPLYPPIPGIPFAAHSAITNVLKSVLLGAAGGQSRPAPQPLPAGGSLVSLWCHRSCCTRGAGARQPAWGPFGSSTAVRWANVWSSVRAGCFIHRVHPAQRL